MFQADTTAGHVRAAIETPAYSIAEEDAEVDRLQDSLDYVHFVVPDINGIPRGRVVPRRFVRPTLSAGIDLFHGTLVFGPRTEPTNQIEEFEREPGNRTWQPDPSTLMPTPWSDSAVSRGDYNRHVARNRTPDYGRYSTGHGNNSMRNFHDDTGNKTQHGDCSENVCGSAGKSDLTSGASKKHVTRSASGNVTSCADTILTGSDSKIVTGDASINATSSVFNSECTSNASDNVTSGVCNNKFTSVTSNNVTSIATNRVSCDSKDAQPVSSKAFTGGGSGTIRGGNNLTSTSSSANGTRRTTGMVLCRLLTADGSVDDLDLRHVVQRLLDRLTHEHGLIFKAAFEYEFVVYEKDTLRPLGSDSFQLLDLRTTQPDLDLLYELSEELAESGFYVTSIQPEFVQGQWELNFEPQEGLWAADFAFHVKNAVKIFFARRGYTASFMSFPRLDGSSSGLHLNHSLWTLDGRNAMRDDSKENRLSEVALRWNTGLLQHASAMTALCCPTVNCYRRLHLSGCPSHVTWSIDNRNSLNRFKTRGGNVYLESRLPSGPANPYLAIACHLAAGLSALSQEVTSPPPMHTDHAQRLPRSLEEAFHALENDQVLQDALGQRLLSYYVTAKRDYEIKAFSMRDFKTDEEKIAFERERYLVSL